MLKIFMDMEFTNLGKDADLISIGMVTQNNITFYAELIDYDVTKASNFVKEHVLPNLKFGLPQPGQDPHWMWDRENNAEIHCKKAVLARWIDDWFQSLLGGRLSWVDYEEERPPYINEPKIEIWSDCLAYDWVLFCDIFGGAEKIPGCVYYIPFDICTVLKMKKIDPDIDRYSFVKFDSSKKHNALTDAQVLRKCFYYIKKF